MLPATALPATRAADAWSTQLQLMLESTGEGIYGIDKEGRCTFINRAAAALIGLRPENVLGRNMHALMHHSHADGRHYGESDCPIFKAFRQGESCRIDSEVMWRADGTSFPAEYSSYPILDGEAVQGAVVTVVDISERKRAEQQLQQSHEQLERRVDERTAELTNALAQLRELSAHMESVREDERTRIAREIHDELGALLVALKMDVGFVAKRVLGQAEPSAKCQSMGRLIDTAVDKLGRIITDLRPSILDHQGLWAALEWQAQEFIESSELRADVQVHVAADVPEPQGPTGERWAIAVFRIFQELLSNVAKHAQAQSLRIRLYVDGPPEATLYLEVADDGVGADLGLRQKSQRYGVLGMRERAAHYGGTLRIDGAPGRGTSARLTMPLP